MNPLDGNAIGGLLHEVFGTEMTGAVSTCVHCGDTGPLALTVVYLDAPGTVVRCRNCSDLLMVFARIHERTCVDLSGLAALEVR
jgi:ribosomal protein S27E